MTHIAFNRDEFEILFLYRCLSDISYVEQIREYCHKPHKLFQPSTAATLEILFNYFDQFRTLPSLAEIKLHYPLEKSEEYTQDLIKKFSKLKEQLQVHSSETTTFFNSQAFYAQTERFLREKHIQSILLEVVQEIPKNQFSLEETIAKLSKISQIEFTTQYIGISVFENIEFIEQLLKQEKRVVYTTGWQWLDYILDGGFHPKTLNVFMGRVNVGKSLVLGNLALNAALAGYNVLLISLEMSEQDYMQRFLSQITEIPCRQLYTHKDLVIEKIKNITQQNNSLGQLLIKEFPPKTLTPLQIDVFLKKLQSSMTLKQNKSFVPHIIFIDYLNLLSSNTRSRSISLYEGMKEISEQVRALSFQWNLPIVTATQINRQSFRETDPGMESIAESLGVAATADFICSIWQDGESLKMQQINFSVAKNRLGAAKGRAAMQCDYQTLRLKEMDTTFSFPEDEIAKINMLPLSS